MAEVLAVGTEAQAALEASRAAETIVDPAVTEPVVDEVTDPAVVTEPVVEEPVVDVEPKFYFGGDEVQIEVPDDIAEALEKNGLNKDEVVAALFAKDGDFSLPPEMREKLDAAYGKSMVDRVLATFKGENARTLDGYKQEHKSQLETMERNTTEFNELVGGDEGFAELDKWASENLDEAELAAVNAAMQLPPEHWLAQRAVLQALKQRAGAGAAEPAGEQPLDLLTDTANAERVNADGVPSKLTKDDYQGKWMRDPRYKSDRAFALSVDNARRAGQSAGI